MTRIGLSELVDAVADRTKLEPLLVAVVAVALIEELDRAGLVALAREEEDYAGRA